MKQNQGLKGLIVLFILGVLIVSFYYYSSNRKLPENKDTLSENTVSGDMGTEDTASVKGLLSMDLIKNYPQSPREVVSIFSDITLCYHNEEYSEEELTQLSAMSRDLFDEELLKNNPEDTYLDSLKSEIEQFEEHKITITGYLTSSSAAIENEKFLQDGYEWTRVYCTYEMKKDGEAISSDEIFLLRKDDAGCWKIYGWDLVVQ